MNIKQRLDMLAGNLYWTWHPEAEHIFRDLNHELWRESNHNPLAFLARIGDAELDAKTALMAIEPRITRVYHGMRHYIESANTWGHRYAGPLYARPVAYFSAEFGIHESIPVYSGGLGVLAGDHLKAASDLGVPIVGVGLLYAKGYFHQSLDKNGWQQEHYSSADLGQLPLKPITGQTGERVVVSLKTGTGEAIRVQAWLAPVGRCQLVLLDTLVQGNSPETQQLTAQLYGGDSALRIRQEFVLGVGGMRMLAAMGIHPGVLHLNEGHSAFALLELGRMLMERDEQSFANVQEMASAMCVFTTHTPVAAGHDRFDPQLVEDTLGALRTQVGLSKETFLALGRLNPAQSDEPFCMTVLGLKMARARTAVTRLHRRVSRSMWRALWPQKTEDEIPIAHVTNGIHLGTWLAPELQRLFARYLGDDWIERMYDPKVWQPIDQMDDEELWEMNDVLQGYLIEFVRRRVRQQYQARGEPDPTVGPTPFLSPRTLTIGFARRFAPYKRSDLLLHDLDRLNRLVNHPEKPIQIIVAGKAHPADEEGKRLLQRIFNVTRDPRFVGRIVFIEDYDINVARHLVQGVNVWLNTPRRPLEACGTSGMKAVLNGGLHLSVLDGWWAEAYDGSNGFAIGNGSEHLDCGLQDRLDAEALYDILEKEVVPMFYSRGIDGVPHAWVQRQKNAFRSIVWRFTAHRMVTDYTRHCYLPALGCGTCSVSD